MDFYCFWYEKRDCIFPVKDDDSVLSELKKKPKNLEKLFNENLKLKKNIFYSKYL